MQKWRVCQTGCLSLTYLNTTECGLFRGNKGMHVTLSGVCLLNYILKNFVLTNCRFVVSDLSFDC